MSISPEPSSSRTSRAFLRRAGCSRNWRFSSPQFLRNLITSSSVFTAFTISAVDSVPPPSLSMSSKHFRAAFKKSPVNSAISRCAARASSSRFAARSASLFLSAISMHSSLRGTSTGELRHQHAIAASKAPQRFRRRNAPLVDVNMPVAVRDHLRERLVEARRDQQVLQVFVAAVDQEINDFLVPASCACESLLRAVVSREHGIVAARKLKQRGRRANITLELPRQSQASRACPTRRRRSFEIPLARPASGTVGYASMSPRATTRFSRRARRIRARRRVASLASWGGGAPQAITQRIRTPGARVQKLETELFIGFLGGALAALALVGELLQALLQAALDGRFPFLDVDFPRAVLVEHSSAFLSRGGWRRNCRFSSPQVLRKSITSLSSFTALTCVKIKQ